MLRTPVDNLGTARCNAQPLYSGFLLLFPPLVANLAAVFRPVGQLASSAPQDLPREYYPCPPPLEVAHHRPTNVHLNAAKAQPHLCYEYDYSTALWALLFHPVLAA